MPPRIIRLNVGGYVVQTAASTLTSGSAYFARLLSSEFTDLDAESNEAFVDRDGRYFPYILGYLRSGAVELPAPPLTVDALLARLTLRLTRVEDYGTTPSKRSNINAAFSLCSPRGLVQKASRVIVM